MENEEEPRVGHYSKKRTRRGNVQVGRLHGRSNLEIARNMQSLVNLKASPASTKKFKAAGALALERQKKKLKQADERA